VPALPESLGWNKKEPQKVENIFLDVRELTQKYELGEIDLSEYAKDIGKMIVRCTINHDLEAANLLCAAFDRNSTRVQGGVNNGSQESLIAQGLLKGLSDAMDTVVTSIDARLYTANQQRIYQQVQLELSLHANRLGVTKDELPAEIKYPYMSAVIGREDREELARLRELIADQLPKKSEEQ
jgi:hypothetical protein